MISADIREMEGIGVTPAQKEIKKPTPIRRERLESLDLAEIITREAERINFRDVKAIVETRVVKVFDREEQREVVNIGNNVIIYGLYRRVTDNEGTFRDVFYEVVPISNLASAYCKDIHPKGISVGHHRRAARLAILVETYCRLFVGLVMSSEVALSVSSGLDGIDNKKQILTRRIGFNVF